MLITEIRIPVPWGYVAVKAWGDPAKFPVMCIHGDVDNAGSFDKLIPLLSMDKFYFVCIDLPGHGASSHQGLGIPYRLRDYLTTVYRVVMYFQWKKFHIIGHQSGALLGFFFASCFPAFVVKLVALEPSFRKTGGHLKDLTAAPLPFLDVDYCELEPLTFKACLQQIARWRPFPMSLPVAEVLMKRNVVRLSQREFRLLPDPRVAYIQYSEYKEDQLKTLLKPLTCQILILTSNVVARSKVAFPVMSVVEMLRKNCGRLEYCLFNGPYDCHIIKPVCVSVIIKDFFDYPKGKL